MLTVTRQQAVIRRSALPEPLQDALSSEKNIEIVERICAAGAIPQDQWSRVLFIAGAVLYGFMHPEDVGQELAEELHIDKRLGDAIAEQLKARIFAPYLETLKSIYAPPETTTRMSTNALDSLTRIIGTGRVAPQEISTFPIASTSKTPVPAPISPTIPAPIKATPGTLPAPFIIHSESVATPIERLGGFKLEVPRPKTNAFQSQPTNPAARSFFEKPARVDISAATPVIPVSSRGGSSFGGQTGIQNTKTQAWIPAEYTGMTERKETSPRAPLPNPPGPFGGAQNKPPSIAMIQAVHPSVAKEVIPAHLPQQADLTPEHELPAGEEELRLPQK